MIDMNMVGNQCKWLIYSTLIPVKMSFLCLLIMINLLNKVLKWFAICFSLDGQDTGSIAGHPPNKFGEDMIDYDVDESSPI